MLVYAEEFQELCTYSIHFAKRSYGQTVYYLKALKHKKDKLFSGKFQGIT